MKINWLIITCFGLFVPSMSAQQIHFEGNDMPVYEEKPNSSTGLNEIYVLYSSDGVSMNYTQRDAGANVTWYSYDERGGGYAEPISGIERVDSRVTTMRQVVPDKGYIIEEGTDRIYVWVADYSDYELDLKNISVDSQRDCGTARLNIEGVGDDIIYYTINGVPERLNRELTVTYRTLEWSDESSMWAEVVVEENEESFRNSIAIPAPYCDTEFTLSGDKFLRFWDMEIEVTSDTYVTSAVAVETTAAQEEREATNEIGENEGSSSTLGGSAPVSITFSAYCTDAMVHKEWQMSTDADFNDIQLRFTEEELVQNLTEAGTFYYRFYGTDNSGECETFGEVYTVSIGESSLECPNVFSPQSSEGVNDEWKVSYKSIVQFQCWIFNRWGIQICKLTDPSQGWDGKYKGKYVKSGTYYYVIEAVGSDGIEYNLKGDINIINYDQNKNSTVN